MKSNKCSFTGYTLFVSLIAAIGGLLFGYNTSVISGALLVISEQLKLTILQQELVVSILLIGAIFGAAIGGALADRYGRKIMLIITAFLFIISTCYLTITSTFIGLLIGRVIGGIAIGIASLVVPLYIAEMSAPQSRGALVSLNQLAITIGILLAYGIDYVFASQNGWRSMFGFGLFPAALFFLGLFFIPETPSFLSRVGKKHKALEIFKKISTSKIQSDLLDVDGAKTGTWANVFSKAVRPALIVGVLISIFQQITGINTVIYYAPRIFQLAGLQSASSAILATFGVGVVNVLLTIVALWLIDRAGRRRLLIIGISGMIASLVLLGFAFIGAIPSLGIVAVLSLMCYVAFFAISLGPVAWLIISEIYPLEVRGKAMSIATFANWGCNFIVSLTFLSLIEWLGSAGAFWLYAAIAMLALWFVMVKVPETKGQTLSKIQEFWKKHYSK